jgi:hypothetical protein
MTSSETTPVYFTVSDIYHWSTYMCVHRIFVSWTNSCGELSGTCTSEEVEQLIKLQGDCGRTNSTSQASLKDEAQRRTSAGKNLVVPMHKF